MLQMEKINFSSLLKAAQEGDQTSYEKFLNSCEKLLKMRLSKWLNRPELKEEIIQEILLGIHRNLHTYQPDRSAEAWIMGIAKFKIADYYRKNPHKFEELNFDVTFEEDSSNEVLSSFDLLPSNLRQAIYLTKVEGLTTKEAAHRLGLKENALRTRISRALVKLKMEILS